MWWMYPPPAQQGTPAFMDKFMEKVLEEYLKEKKKDDGDKKEKDTPIKLNVVEVASFMMLIHVPIVWVLVWSWLSR